MLWPVCPGAGALAGAVCTGETVNGFSGGPSGAGRPGRSLSSPLLRGLTGAGEMGVPEV